MRPSPLLPVLLLLVTATAAHADRVLCGPGVRHRGAVLDLDVKSADLHDVFRLLADVGKVNLVIASDVAGKVTMKLARVPWDQIACTIAAVHKLEITVNGTIYLVGRASSPPRPTR